MRAKPTPKGWYWSVRPPGGGYEVYSGEEAQLDLAKVKAERALEGLLQEIRNRKAPE